MRSLRAQLTLAILLVVAVTVAAISLLANVFIERRFDEYVAEQQAIRASGIVNDLAMQYSTETLAWNQDFIHAVGMYSLYDGYILRVFDADGAVVWDAMNHDMSLCGQIMSDIAARMDRVGAGGGFVTREYNLMRAGGKIGSVEIEYYGPYFLSESDFRFLGALNTALLGASVFAFALSLAIGAVLARRIARPVTNAAALAKRISAGDYDTDFDSAPATRELFDLVAAVNHLSGALREQEILRRRLTRDVAHELRTPVTAVSSHLEAMLEGVWEPTPERLAGCREEILRLGRLISDLERLAQAESENLKLKLEEVELSSLVRDAADGFAAEAARKGVALTASGDAAVVSADRDRISQVVSNLLSNALKYTDVGGNIHIFAQDNRESGEIIVEDDGIGVAEDELPLIFERFYRTDRSRSRETGGAGIGLAIVKSIVSAHGGVVSAESGSRGTRFVVTLPKP